MPFISLIILGERFCGRRFYLEAARKMAEVRPFKENVQEQCLGDGSLPSKAYREERVMILLERSRGAEKRKGPGEGQGVRVVIWDCGNEM